MVTAFLGIGIPKSGKTEVLKQLAIAEKSFYISANELRMHLARTDFSRRLSETVWEELYRLTHHALGGGQNVVIDASNAQVHDRRELAAHCRQLAHEVIGIYIRVPLHVCLNRNRQHGANAIPDHAIKRLAQELEWHPPCHRDGFDEIRIIEQ